MKNTFIILSFISIGITPLYAQSSNRYDWGIEGGPNLSTFIIKNNPYVNPEMAVLGSGGFIFQYNTKKILSFKTGFSYQRKGYKLSNIDDIDAGGNYLQKGKLISRFDYVTLPLLVKATFGKKVRFFVNAGPYVGYLLAQTDRHKLTGKDKFYKNEQINGLNRWDFGFTGGIGIAIPIKEKWLITIEARNYSGIMNIATNGTKLHTNTTDLNIGFAYKMGLRNPINETNDETNDVSSKKDKPQIDIGIESGPNLSFFIQKGYVQMGGSYPSTNIPTIFASTGLTFQFNCKKIFSIRTGLSYQQKGYRPTKPYDVAKTTLRFDYLTIPILARFTFGKKVHFFVNVGVFGSFLAGTTKRTKYVDDIKKGHQTNPPGYNAGDAGFTGGLGISVPIKTHWLISLEARNYSGVLDISNSHGNTFNSHYKLDLTNTSDLLLGVAYRLRLRDVK